MIFYGRDVVFVFDLHHISSGAFVHLMNPVPHETVSAVFMALHTEEMLFNYNSCCWQG